MRYGVQLFSLRNYLKDEAGYQEVFSGVKAMGADVVQLSCTMSSAFKPDMVAEFSREFELPVCITHSPYERIMTDTEKLAEEHLSFDCHEIGVGMMPKKFRENNFALLGEFTDSLSAAAEKLKAYGIAVAYHNHWFEFNKIGDKTVFDVLMENTSKDVRFIPDSYWIKVGGEDPAGYLSKLDGRVKTVHLKDYKKTCGIPLFRTPGKGILDFKAYCAAAESIGAENAVVEIDFSPNPWKSVENGMKFIDENLR